jgi:hypothetical protein
MNDLVEESGTLARKMVTREMRGSGDHANALDRVARECKMTPRSLRRIMNGETKDPGVRGYANIKAAYLVQLSRLIASLQSELLTETAKNSAMNVGTIDEDIEAISQKLKQARQGR